MPKKKKTEEKEKEEKQKEESEEESSPEEKMIEELKDSAKFRRYQLLYREAQLNQLVTLTQAIEKNTEQLNSISQQLYDMNKISLGEDEEEDEEEEESEEESEEEEDDE